MTDQVETNEMESRPAPVSSGERIAAVDVLRGFAVFGILLINIYGFSGLLLSPQSETDRLDRLVMILLVLLVQAKFYSMFSFLFGWGMSIQLERAAKRGANFVRLYLRRMLILLLFGLIHGIFLWRGDILTTYAILGIFLLLFRRAIPRALLIWVALFLLLSIIVVLPGGLMDEARELYAQATEIMRTDNLPPQSVFGNGSYGIVTERRAGEFISGLSWFIYWLGNVFAMMLLGLYAGKRRILQDVEGHLPLIRRTLWLGLIIGLAFNAIAVWVTVDTNAVPAQYQRFVRVSARTIGAPALMLFYASGLALLLRKESWRQRLAPLAPVGRMALSNYLLQSVLAGLLFYSYGLGLYGDITPTVALFIVIIIYLIQIRISGWWMDRYRFGPAEWLWRTLTYGQLQQLRREPIGFIRQARSPLSRLSQRLSGLNPMLCLLLAWIILIAWAGVLFAWNGRLDVQSGGASFTLFSQDRPDVIAGAATSATATPIRPVAAEPEIEALATPIVRAAEYRPSVAAAAGNVQALNAALDVQQAIDHIETLTGPAYAGRLAGATGGQAAGDYIAGYFARYGLQPASLDGTFFQSFPITYTTLTGVPQIEVTLPDGSPAPPYSLYEQFSPLVIGYAGGGQGMGPVHWVNQCREQDFADLELLGKIVFCKLEPGNDALVTSSRLALEYGAAGLLLMADEQVRPADFAGRHQELWVPETIPVLRVYPPLVDDLLAGSGLSAEELLRAEEPRALKTEASLAVETSDSTQVTSRNVLGVLPGRDPDYAHEIIIVGGHYDHMGEGPDGTMWAGANDNASGVAAVLEIARSWHETGFVPRRTVLFAAWDAEEWGLIGSRHYVEHPSYPLENTVASFQMDMVGAGPGALAINGNQELAGQQLQIAEALGLEAITGNSGRSDHVPFLEAGVPATLLIWHSDEEPNTHYHRPADTPDVIEPQRLDAVLNVANSAILDLAESEPAIEELVALRAAAAASQDLSGFLSTSHPDQSATDSRWFADLGSLQPGEIEMSIQDIEFDGPLATADVAIGVSYGEDAGRLLVSQPVHFSHTDAGWLWAGPALSWYRSTPQEIDSGAQQVRVVLIGYPTGIEADQSRLAHLVAEQYTQVARQLALPENSDIRLLLMPDEDAIRFNTSLSLPDDTAVWVEPGLAQLVYGSEISQSQRLNDTIVQLVLANAGVNEQAAPWLWRGLPIAWQAGQDLKRIHNQHLPQLNTALHDEASQPSETASPSGPDAAEAARSWAAVEYLVQEVGWEGVGQFIQEFGQACANDSCDNVAGIDQAMILALQTNSDSFDDAWQEHWRARLDEVQINLDRLLLHRSQALLNGDKEGFLATVDPDDAYLLSSESVWFDRLAASPVTDLSLTAQPSALLDNGDVLAAVTIDYQAVNQVGESPQDQPTIDVLFTPDGDGYQWAGVDGQALAGDLVTVRFPDGEDALAQSLLADAEKLYAELAGTLEVQDRQSVVLDLYPDRESFRIAIGLAYPTSGWLPAWSDPGSGIKVQLQNDESPGSYRATLVYQLARYLMYQKGLTDEWLLKGLGAQLGAGYGGRETQRALAATLAETFSEGSGYEDTWFLSISTDELLSAPEWLAETAYAWDSATYLIASESWPAVLAFMEQVARTDNVAAAFASAFGRSLSDFEQEWRAAVASGYASPLWTEAVNRLDGEAALEHVDYLGSENLAGRQAGTPGAEIAAGYIAQRFAEYGLQPAGDLHASSYFQSFPITFTERIGKPSLQIVGDPLLYGFRTEFLPVYSTLGSVPVQGELTWLGRPDGQTQDLTGKVALAIPGENVEQIVEAAVAHNAAGLLLLGLKQDEVDLYAKQPLAPSILADIPVLELTVDGSLRLLETLDLSYDSIQELPPGTALETSANLVSAIATRGPVRTTNVLGLLPGADPLLSQQVIVLGAHYDHVGDDPPGDCDGQVGDCTAGVRYSGSNDNASGVAIMLEIARFWHEIGYQPKHSILFAAWGAQEAGQLGSGHYIGAPVLPLTSTIAMVQLDGLGGGEGFYPGLHAQPGADDYLIQAMTSAAAQLEQKIVLASSPGESDHLPFRHQGVPAALVSWRLASENNLPDDLANGVSPERIAASGRVVALALMMMAR